MKSTNNEKNEIFDDVSKGEKDKFEEGGTIGAKTHVNLEGTTNGVDYNQ